MSLRGQFLDFTGHDGQNQGLLRPRLLTGQTGLLPIRCRYGRGRDAPGLFGIFGDLVGR